MVTCIMCRKQVNSYPGYVTDGIVSVCNVCAASNSLARIMTRIENLEIEANLKSVFAEMVDADYSLVDQTNGRVELDKSKLDAKAGLVDQTNDTVEFSPIKERVEGLIDVCRVVWESSHNKQAVYDKFAELANHLSDETSFSISELGLPDPAYIRSDGTISEVPASILASGNNLSFEEIELEDDIMHMSQGDFYSKYANNMVALNAYYDANGETVEFLEY